jgi:hypothetical protein
MLAPRSSIFCKQEQKRFSQNVSVFLFCFVFVLLTSESRQSRTINSFEQEEEEKISTKIDFSMNKPTKKTANEQPDL